MAVVLLGKQGLAQMSWKGTAAVVTGYESNIFKSPDAVDSKGDTLNPITSDSFLGIELDLGARYDLGSLHQFTLSYSGDEFRYADNENVNQYRHSGDLQYRLKAGTNTYFYVNGGIGYLQKLGTNVLGEGLTRLYTSKNYLLEPRLRHQTTDYLRNDLEYIYKYKDYDETEGYTSIDYREHEFNLSTLFDPFDSKFRSAAELILGYIDRQYIEYSSRDVNGNTSADYPTRNYTYFTVTLGYNHPFDLFDVELYSRYRTRRDNFEDYYSYNELRLSSRIRGNITEDIHYYVFVSWRDRDYLQKTANQDSGAASDEPNLIWKNIDFKTQIKYQFMDNMSVEAIYRLDNRDTNVTDLTARTNREYTDHSVSLAFVVDF
ncbi:MAG: hypothetical protein E4H13_03920 [Calditrichales bacterium]|nr:MAG: hypothetical protein E4H13_03920 [Calditrichales bacterium]